MKKRTWIHIFFTLAAVCLFFAGMETIQRIRHPYVGFRHMRNSLGFRSPEFTLRKKTGTIRILFIGSSTTFGTNGPLETTFPFLAEKILKEQMPEIPLEVINAAEPCKTSAWEVRRMRETLYLEPDIMVVMTGYNDSATIYSELTGIDESGNLTLTSRLVKLDAWIAHHSVFYVTLREKLSMLLYGNPRYAFDPPARRQETLADHSRWFRDYPPIFRENLEQMISLCSANKIKLVFIKPPLSPGRRRERPNYEKAYLRLTEELTSVCSEHKIPVINLDDLYPDSKWREYVSGDGLHFTDKGNAEIARRVAEYFIQHKKNYF